jgi:hypothetical protein
MGRDHVHDPHATSAVGAVSEGSAPVGLEHAGEGGGHLSGLLGGQPEVGVAQVGDVLPLLGLLVLGRDERLPDRPAAVPACSV